MRFDSNGFGGASSEHSLVATRRMDVVETRIQGAYARYLSERTRMKLDKGVAALDTDRPFCRTCPAALICAAAEVLAADRVPELKSSRRWKREDAMTTLSSLSIVTVDHPDHPKTQSLCFRKIIGAIDSGIMMPAGAEPTPDDPLNPDSLVHLADRVFSYTQDATGRLTSGQRI